MAKREIYIVLTATGTLLSKTIQTYTKESYSHVSLALDKQLDNMYSFGRKNPINPLDGGFVKEDVVFGTYSWFPETHCLIYSLEIEDKNYKKIENFIRVFEKNKDKYGYNFIGLFGFVFGTPIEVKGMYFCSQFVAEILNRSGVRLFEKPSGLIKPPDFQQVKGNDFRILYEGRLYDYPPVSKRVEKEGEKFKYFSFRKYAHQQIKNDIEEKDMPLSFRHDYLRLKKIQLDEIIQKRQRE